MTRRKKIELFFLVTLPGETIFFFSCHFFKEKKPFEENFYINIQELININISADGHVIIFV